MRVQFGGEMQVGDAILCGDSPTNRFVRQTTNLGDTYPTNRPIHAPNTPN